MSFRLHMQFQKAFIIFAMSLSVTGCVKTTKVVYSDKDVSVTLKDTVNLINVHASAGFFEMTVCGAKYSEVRGWIPFYLTIPQKDSILFVTGRDYDNGQATVHVVNLKTKTETHFPAYDSRSGSNIRNTNNVDEFGNVEMFENVENLNGDEVVIAAGASNIRYRYYLNLQKSEFEKEERYPTNYSSTNIWLNGKNPRN